MIFYHNTYSKNLAIYIHWPFCESKCPYCDFNSYVTEDINDDVWEKAYLSQIDYLSQTIINKNITSIFFGGGTPSLMNPKIVKHIISKISSLAKLDPNIEITLEANPSSIEISKFQEFKAAGINRVSVGIQALNKNDLTFLGRKHSLPEALNALGNISEIFSNWSFDLIYARPNQSILAWQEELNRALELTKTSNNHISCYQLTIESGTPFFKDYHSNKFLLPNDNVAADMFRSTNDVLLSQGYSLYEISNHAKIGFESKHNLCYWNYDDYLGIGPGAHSRISFVNTDGTINVQAAFMEYKPENFLKAKDLAFQKITILTEKEIIDEILMMGLRLSKGLNEERLHFLTGKTLEDVLDKAILKNFRENDIVYFKNKNLRINEKSLILHNYITSRLISNN